MPNEPKPAPDGGEQLPGWMAVRDEKQSDFDEVQRGWREEFEPEGHAGSYVDGNAHDILRLHR